MILLKRKYSALPTDVSVPSFESGCSTTTIVPSDRPVEIYKKLKVTQEQSNVLEMAAVASALLNRKKKEYDQDLTRLGKNYERIRGIMYQLNIQISSVVNTRCCAICTKQLGKLKMIQCINNLQSKVETCMKHLTRTRFIVNSNSLIISSESYMEQLDDAQTTKAFMQGRLDLIRKQKNNVLRQRRCEYCRSNVPNQELARFLQQSDQLACYLAHKLQ